MRAPICATSREGPDPRWAVTEHRVQGGVEEPHLATERGKDHPTHGEALGRAEEVRGGDRHPERARRQRAVEIDLGAVGTDQAHALAVATVEARPHLGGPAARPAAGCEPFDDAVVVLGPHEQVDVAEAAPRRIRIVEVCDGSALEHPELGAERVELRHRLEQHALEVHATLHSIRPGGQHRGPTRIVGRQRGGGHADQRFNPLVDRVGPHGIPGSARRWHCRHCGRATRDESVEHGAHSATSHAPDASSASITGSMSRATTSAATS